MDGVHPEARRTAVEDTEQITIFETVLDHVQASALSVEDSRVWLEARLNQLD
ncbi:hypothetical protein [Nocardiopsis prasina]|uniref:hypothetical protein n=1 Tax=Nocardiopsis prasina TaxID=2015 RepID=UPI000346F706|nr:hypothetical protein [Nocardiopsis prasina]